MQVAALMKGRDYVSSEDVIFLAPYVFGHRMELTPGVDDGIAIVKECLKEPVEQLTRKSLTRR